MWFANPSCPKCGARAVSVLGRVLTAMPLVPDSVNGEPGFDFGSDPEILWDTQETVTAAGDAVRLTCPKHHHWWTAERETAPEPTPSVPSTPIQGDLL